ncbi:hypothetical protein EJ08DRAFT_656495 [Tothia fuscella]|uniref:Mitochondrial outer membrane protein OM14 C-terminal domain-containing protein n=1 Tax=Tothia fuscella TaxID=1048955 RepID=A0A9P4P2K3_9PEZI|nr:hypothetical protein EJ08DRAFT_656495 [Tothia fuscella]
MSYADIAKKGPHQSPEEARAPPVPELEHTDGDSTASLVDVDSPHISSVPSDYESQSIKTDTQAERIEHEQSDAAIEKEKKTREKAQEAKEKAAEVKEKAKAKANKAGSRLQANSDNPVVVGNAIVVGVLGAVFGVGAYRKYTAGEITWKVVGAWAGVVGLFAAGDYYVSQYLFKKYPPKK